MIKIKTVSKGAELISIEKDGIERMHDGQKDWNRHSPVLFPIVGKLKDNMTLIEGKEYKMNQHGFARDMDFEKIGENLYIVNILIMLFKIERKTTPPSILYKICWIFINFMLKLIK